MNTMKKAARKGGGATAIEYGLIAALIAVAIITFVSNFGSTDTKAPRTPAAQEQPKK